MVCFFLWTESKSGFKRYDIRTVASDRGYLTFLLCSGIEMEYDV